MVFKILNFIMSGFCVFAMIATSKDEGDKLVVGTVWLDAVSLQTSSFGGEGQKPQGPESTAPNDLICQLNSV